MAGRGSSHKRPGGGRGRGRVGITVGSGPSTVGEPLAVAVTTDAAFSSAVDWDACPWALQTRVPNAAGITVQAVYTVPAWDEAAVGELLSWFAASTGNQQGGGPHCAASVLFPAWLPKDDRARVHAVAEQQRCGLVALSDGIGDDRHITVHTRRSAELLSQHRAAACVADDTAGDARERQLDDLAAVARNTPGRESLSLGELRQMLRQDAVPPDLAAQLESIQRQRQQATLLVIAARRGDAAALAAAVPPGSNAAAILGREDPQSGETPLHAAARTNNVELLTWMLAHPGVSPDARDGKGRSLLEVARRADACEVEAALLAAGAVDATPCAVADFALALAADAPAATLR